MATAGLKAKLAHPLHAEKRNSRPPPINEEQREKEKRFVLDYESHSLYAEPDKNHLDLKRTALGTASKQLRIQDFELVKTLGTGMRVQWTCAKLGRGLGSLLEFSRHLRSGLASKIPRSNF